MVTIARITTARLNSLLNAPLGPGGVIVDMPQIAPDAIERALAGDDASGRLLGAMSASPSVEVSHETQDLTENLVGINARLKGATQLQRSDAALSVELVELTTANLSVIDPTIDWVDWNSAGNQAATTRGTGNAQVRVVSKLGGIAGNSLTFAIVVGGNNTPLSVTKVGDAITVNAATNGSGTAVSTAAQVIAAINASVAASAAVRASSPTGSDGTGVVAASASAALTGGTAGTAVGKRGRNRGFINLADYYDNVVLVLENLQTKVFFAIAVYNAISLDSSEFEFDDEGNTTGIQIELMGHSGPESLDPVGGNYLPPYEYFRLNEVVQVP